MPAVTVSNAVIVVVPETARYSAFAAPMFVVEADAMVELVWIERVMDRSWNCVPS